MSHPIHGLYAIADTGLLDPHSLIKKSEAALQGGARILQYRDKTGSIELHHQQAVALAALCTEYGALFIINDGIELAAELAVGLHLGKDDTKLAAARKRLGDSAIIGISCYNKLELALTAQQQGASYVAFGRFFPSSTKPDAVQADVALLHEASKKLSVPIVAIGGINADNAVSLIEAGADAVAVIHDLFGGNDPQAAAARYQTLFKQ